MKDYYSQFLTKKNEITPVSQVSKVSKGVKTTQKRTFDTFDTDHLGVNQEIFISHKLSVESKTVDIRQYLNELASRGCKLNLIDNGDSFDYPTGSLTDQEIEFLKMNFDGVRAILFQGWLMQNVFKGKPDLLEQFKTETNERIALMNDDYLGGVTLTAWQWWLDFQLKTNTSDLRGEKFEEMLELHKRNPDYIDSLPPSEQLSFGRYMQQKKEALDK